jgi:hypothetical protein
MQEHVIRTGVIGFSTPALYAFGTPFVVYLVAKDSWIVAMYKWPRPRSTINLVSS